MKRRDFVKLGAAAAAGVGAGKLAFGQEAQPMAGMPLMGNAPQEAAPAGKADYTLEIAPHILEVAPNIAISTIAYNGKVPGPLIRVKEGQQVTIDVVNNTDTPEFVHWHGLFVPSEVDGAEEEGTPVVPPHGRRRYQFVAKPAGLRWYHTHTMSMMDLHRGSYTGQFGFLMIDPASNPGRYDQEVFLSLRDWEPFLTTVDSDEGEPDPSDPMPEKPAKADDRPNGLEIGSRLYSINDKALGGGEPIRVKQGQRVMMRILNSSASQIFSIALPFHKFQIMALDGNPVPTQKAIDVLQLGPGERADAIVEMSHPGNWILGCTRDDAREAGMGVVVEYANQKSDTQWAPPPKGWWDYLPFGKAGTHQMPDQTIDMVIEKIPGGPHDMNHWTINGKEYPHENEFVLKQGQRYNIVLHNRNDDDHPIHMHRHLFELLEFNGKPTGGIVKDTLVMQAFSRATVQMVADQPGLTLFHCHIQMHMDFGFKALFRYA
jgi:FtsP/CotA-like multicopper oxidase with cupredoxin domain